MTNKILVVLLHGIGDSLMAAPAISELKKKFPGSTITIMAIKNPLFNDLWKNNKDVDSVLHSSLDYNPRYGHPFFWLSDFWKIRKDIKDAVRENGFNKVYFVKMFLMPSKIYSILKLKRYREHKTLRVARELRVKINSKSYSVSYNASDKRWAESFLRKHKINSKKLVGLHFSGSSANKSLNHYIGSKVISMLVSNGYKAVLFHSKSSYAKEKIHYDNIVMYVSDSILRTAALVDKCKLLICVDSGISHIAAGFNKPVFVIYFRDVWAKNSLAIGRKTIPFVYKKKVKKLLDSVCSFIK